MDLDPRFNKEGDISIIANGYSLQVCRLINPDSKDFTLLYGASGADITSPFLAANPTRAIYVDLSSLEDRTLQTALSNLKKLPLERIDGGEEFNQDMQRFIKDREKYPSSISGTRIDGSHFMSLLEWKLIVDLKSLRVDLSTVTIKDRLVENGSIEIQFPWKHHLDKEEKVRTLIYIPKTDITKPDRYPKLLKDILASGIDAFFMKAAYIAARGYPDFLPMIGNGVKEGGYLMTTDVTALQEDIDPEPCLERAGMRFVRRTTEGIEDHINASEDYFFPTSNLIILDRLGPEQREQRPVGCEQRYKLILSLRQKES